MSEYIKYQHFERLGADAVDGILHGKVYVFPKLDGTNAHVWISVWRKIGGMAPSDPVWYVHA